ncbi:hypothetical protein RUM43_007201 [Polyplax serrata]|uniref:Uncharacterized protein n=1 Tax=Polyplax serrata TaxID=468196 RepID=A0AAN8PMC2_POLSC
MPPNNFPDLELFWKSVQTDLDTNALLLIESLPGRSADANGREDESNYSDVPVTGKTSNFAGESTGKRFSDDFGPAPGRPEPVWLRTVEKKHQVLSRQQAGDTSVTAITILIIIIIIVAVVVFVVVTES